LTQGVDYMVIWLRQGDQSGGGEDPQLSVTTGGLGRIAGRICLFLGLVAGSAAVLNLPELDSAAGLADGRLQHASDEARIEDVALSPDCKYVATCGEHMPVQLWPLTELDQSRLIQPINLASSSGRLAVAFSPDGRRLAACGIDSLTVWSLDQGSLTPLLMDFQGAHRCLAIAPDGQTLAIGDDHGTIRILDMTSGELMHRLDAHNDVVRSVMFSPDGQRLVSAGQDRLVMLWSTVTGKAIRNLSPDGFSAVQHAVFSPDGRWIAVGDVSGAPEDVRILDAQQGALVSRLSGMKEGILAMAFAPEGRRIAAAGGDRTIRVWDLKTRSQIHLLDEHVAVVRSLAFSPDGTRIAFAGPGQTVSLWDLNRPKLVTVDCRTWARNAYWMTETRLRAVQRPSQDAAQPSRVFARFRANSGQTSL